MRPTRRRPSTALAGLLGTLLLGGLVACGEERSSAATTEPPEKGECRLLTPEDVARPSNGTATVPCGDRHTAQTFQVGELPEELHDLEPDDPALGTHVYGECSSSFAGFLKGDESAVMRSVVSWVWFRPDDASWDAGARWFRCDVIGGGEQLTPYRALPKNAKGLLEGLPPDQWMVCATGRSVQAGTKVPCSEPHTWRAVTTIKGLPDVVRLRVDVLRRGRVGGRQPALGLLGQDAAVAASGPGVSSQKPSLRSWRGSRCQSLATLTCRSR